MLITVSRDVTYNFTIRAMVNKTGMRCNQTVHYPDPSYTKDGVVKEIYVVLL
jgi:hypothetical protein